MAAASAGGEADVNGAVSEDLACALKTGDLDSVKAAVEAGADVNAKEAG